jgi:RNA polymerase sigma factor (sigma-70 family)
MAHGTLNELERDAGGAIDRVSETQSFLKSLVVENHGALIRFIRRRIGDADEADDIAQDLYCQIARQPHAADIKQPRAYLFRAARNLLYNRSQHRRSINAAGHISIDDATEVDVMSHAPSPEHVTQGRQELVIVEAAIAELSPKCRAAFLMVRFEGRSYKDVAARMGLSVKSIEYYIRQALTHIRVRVDASEGDFRRRQAAE